MKTKRFWVILAVVAVVVLGGGAYLMLSGGNDKVTYRFDKVDRGDIDISITATGTLSADTTVQVGSQVSGTIAHLYADFNMKVKKGQLLAQLDPTMLQATVNEQKASMDRALAQANDAQRTMRRTEDLFKKNLVAQSDMDAATTTLESNKAAYEQAKASYERAVVNLKYATIASPINGVVISRNVDVGQTVAASLQAPTLFSIANDLSKMQVQASIDEADIGNVQKGQEVAFRVDAYPDQEFHGRVSQVRLAPTITQNVVNYTVIIDVANPDLKLMPGMTANVSILVNGKDNVLRIPIQATKFVPPGAANDVASMQGRRQADAANPAGGSAQQAPQQSNQPGSVGENGGRSGRGGGRGGHMRRSDSTAVRAGSATAPQQARARVWVLENGKPKPITIVRGIQNTRYVEVVAGDLKEGDQVIVGAIGGQTAQANGAQNPFQPRMTGGGGPRRGGF